MDELIKKALGFLRGMWRFRWPGMAVAWLVAIIGVVLVFRIPDQFEASARIYVDTDSVLRPLMAGLAVTPNVQQQVNMLSRTLLSRPNLEKLVRSADLDLKASSPADREELITRLSKSIEIRNAGRDNLYTLALRDSDRESARRTIQALTSIFVESSLGSNRQDTDTAKNFLNEQIRRFEEKLEQAEAKLKEFKIRNIQTRGDDGKDATQRVAEAARELESAKLQLREAENARDSIKAQITASRTPAPGAGPAPETAFQASTPELDGRINEVKRSIDGLLQRYTDRHPDIVMSKRLLQELEQQRVREVAEQRKAAKAALAAAGPGASDDPAVQELSKMLASVEVQVASLRARVGEYAGRLAQAREGLKTAPQLEAEAAQLNRDYGLNKRSYDELIARRQSAMMAGELENASGMAEFRLIDPPRVTPQPVAPNRLMLLPGALLAGLGAGLALSLLLSQIRPAVYDPGELRNVTGLPVLGVVSLRRDDAFKRKERNSLLRFAGASFGLVSLFGIGLAVTAAMR